MSLQHWTAIVLLAGLPWVAAAQATKPKNPADPAAAVAAPVYESAFTDYQTLREEKETPDKVWRRANDEMATLGGHVGHTKEGRPLPTTPAAEAGLTATPQPDAKVPQKAAPLPGGHDMHKREGK